MLHSHISLFDCWETFFMRWWNELVSVRSLQFQAVFLIWPCARFVTPKCLIASASALRQQSIKQVAPFCCLVAAVEVWSANVLTRILFQGFKESITLKFRDHPAILVGHFQKGWRRFFIFFCGNLAKVQPGWNTGLHDQPNIDSKDDFHTGCRNISHNQQQSWGQHQPDRTTNHKQLLTYVILMCVAGNWWSSWWVHLLSAAG